MSENLSLVEMIEGVDELVSLPDVVIKANELIDSKEADVDDIAQVIRLDPSLSAQLLRLVNSAFYRMPSKIDTISRAITVIGVNELRSLILSASAVEVFNKIAADTIDMDDFWFRSVFVGLAAKQILSDRRQAEQMFLMGLLHNVGQIVLFHQADEVANKILNEAKSSHQSLYQIERNILGYDSAQISAALLKSWGLSENLWTPIEQMNDDDFSQMSPQACVLKLASYLAGCAEPEIKSQNIAALSAIESETKLLAMTGVQVDELEEIMDAVNLSCFEVLGVINPSSLLVF